MSEITPYICVADARAAIRWYTETFGAEVVVEPIMMDDDRVGHVELAVDGARWMMSDEFDAAGVAAPPAGRGAAVTLHLTHADVDGLSRRASEAGAHVDRQPEDTPHGRIAVLTDPFGHRWMLNTPTG
ncbi:VOC family protein [Phycicoccus avicenniae]|uniref:VOC family protein n=1 Tax=Phycicoccus avicenniae TaxID=2828860 RepID=UPI003D2C5FD2